MPEADNSKRLAVTHWDIGGGKSAAILGNPWGRAEADEYIGDFSEQSRPQQMANSGVLCRITKTQQIDMHLGFGMNSNSPSLTTGLGYSFRIVGL